MTECIVADASFSVSLESSSSVAPADSGSSSPANLIDKFGGGSRTNRSNRAKSLNGSSPPKLFLGRLNRREIVGDFDGGDISTDGGVLLLSQVDQHYGITRQVAECFTDHRDAAYVEYPIETLLKQRIYGIAQGYEDLNDHDQWRHDPVVGTAVGKLESTHGRCAPLAGKSTLNRLEKSYRQDESVGVHHRYVKTAVEPKALAQVFLDLFIANTPIPPKVLRLDMDVTDDTTYGNQELSGYNRHYQSTCYTPLYIFCGRDLLVSRLRPANVDPAAGALEELKRVVSYLRQQWPEVVIMVRGDSAYARDDIMHWCERQPYVEYVLAMGTNRRLEHRAQRIEAYAKADYQAARQATRDTLLKTMSADELSTEELDAVVPPAVSYGCFHYQTLDSWQRQRRIVCKVTYGPKGPRRHFVVTSWSSKRYSSKALHQKQYCPRGEMENRIKEQQLDLFSGRTSNHYFDDNQLRLWLNSLAYVLLNRLRDALHHTALANARVGTIRAKLLKVATLIRVRVRRIHLALNSSFDYRELFVMVHQRLSQTPPPSG